MVVSSGVRPRLTRVRVSSTLLGPAFVAAIAYVHDGTVDTMKLENQLVKIVRINVVAGFNGSAWQRVSGMVQYAVLEGGGESI